MKPKDRILQKATLSVGEGLALHYYLCRPTGGVPYLAVVAEDENGCRYERSGGLPAGGEEALAFFRLAVSAAVTPYTLIEIYDDFILRVTEKA